MKDSSVMKRILLFIVVLSLGLFSSLYVYSRVLHSNLENEVISSLHEVSGQSVKILRKEILSEINLLDGISNEISEKRLKDPKKLAESFQKVTEKYQFKRMGIILVNGKVYTSDRKEGNLSLVLGLGVLEELLVDLFQTSHNHVVSPAVGIGFCSGGDPGMLQRVTQAKGDSEVGGRHLPFFTHR